MKKILMLMLATTNIGAMQYNWRKLKGIEITNQMQKPIQYMTQDERNVDIQPGTTTTATLPIDIHYWINLKTTKGTYAIFWTPINMHAGYPSEATFLIELNGNPITRVKPSWICAPLSLVVKQNGELQLDMRMIEECPSLPH